MSYNSPLNFFSLSKYTFIKFMTSHNKGLLVGWNGKIKGGGGRGRVPLGKKIFLGGRVTF